MNAPFGLHRRLPKNWESVAIKDVTSDWRGGAPFEPEDFTEQGFPVLHKGAIQKGGQIAIDPKKKTFTTESFVQSHQKSVIDQSYVAVTLRDLVPSGPSIGLVADLARFPSQKYILAQGAYGFHIDRGRLNPTYLVWLSNYEPFRLYMKRYAVGSTQIHVRTPVFQDLEIPLPQIEEQRRIADILDRADAIRRKRQEAIRMTEELLRSAFLEMFGDPVTNPKGWDVKPLANVVHPDTIVTYGIVQAGSHVEDGIPYIRTGDIKNSQISESGLLRTSSDIAQKYKRSEVHTGDLVMSIRATVGTVARVPESLNGANLTQGTAKISPGSNVNGNYLFWFIQSNGCQNWIQKQVKGATFREITLTRLREMPVMLPPLDLQSKFSRIIEQTTQCSAKLKLSKSKKNDLFNSLLQRAFRGEL
ncbi:MAG: restriction endonuclease subunit S [Phormidesmis sp. CAN_BIN44]|nr:restriction endonuclease subunit S [Phormidesmis sp. CAN_BIN44]